MRVKLEKGYPECATCTGIGSCPYRVVLDDGLGSVFPPEDCPHPMDVLKNMMKTKKKLRNVRED
jgi:hypothetical protein